MRQIKFRAWDKKGKKMIVSPPGEDFDWSWFADSFASVPNEFEIMQFAGLHDKNGKEIYFGDIVEAEGCGTGENDPQYDAIRGSGRQKLFCECDPNYLRIRFTQQQNGLFEFSPHELKEIKIIGNIYENEDLLK